MDIINKLNELDAFADLIKNRVEVLKKEMVKKVTYEKRDDNNTLGLRAKIKAKRAIGRLP